MYLKFATLIFLLITCFVRTEALSHKSIAQHGSWSVAEVPKSAIYVLASPQRSEGKYSRRGRAYAMITFWHRGDTTIHFEQGYTVKKGSKVVVNVLDKRKKIIKKYSFIPHNEEAWAPESLDRNVLNFMKKGYYLQVFSTSSRGTKTKDTYDLSGVSRSIAAASGKQQKKTKPSKKITSSKKVVQTKKTTGKKKNVVKAGKSTTKSPTKKTSSKRKKPVKKTISNKSVKKRIPVINKSPIS